MRSVQAICLAALLLLTACLTTNQTTFDTKFSADDPDCIVIVGSNSILAHKYFAGLTYPSLEMYWTSLYPEEGKTIRNSFILAQHAELRKEGRENTDANVQYQVYRVAAGNYRLAAVNRKYGSSLSQTIFDEDYMPRFSIKPGEVVYIGDFHFEIQSSGLAKLRKHGFEEAKAKQVLAQYPNVKQDFAIRLVSTRKPS